MKRISLVFAVISAGMFSSAAGEEYLLRIEDLTYKDTDFQSVKDMHEGVPRADGKKLEGETWQLAEIQIRPGSPFYTKAVVGRTTVTIKGELKPGENADKLYLTVKRIRTDGTGKFLKAPGGRLIENAPITTTAYNGSPIEVGKTVVLGGGHDDKNPRNVRVTTIRLDPVQNAD